MAILAGEIVTAGRLNRMQPTTYEAVASGNLTMTNTTTESDIPGATVTFSTAAANAVFVAVGVFDGNVSTTNTTTIMLGKLSVDGVIQTGTATHAMDTADRDSVTETWRGTLASAGSHTIKLRGSLNAATGVGSWLATNTKLSITIYEVV